MKKVSVIVPSYNCERYIGETIQGILGQSYENIELIIIDDASSDGSIAIINSFKDKRIYLYQNKANLGVSETLNIGLSHATGEYISFCGADDVFEINKTELQVRFLDQNPTIGGVFSLAQLIDQKGRPTSKQLYGGNHTSFSSLEQQDRFGWLRSFFVGDNSLCASSLLAKRDVLMKMGCFDERLTLLQDHDLNVRLCVANHIHVLPEYTVRYRVHSRNLSRLTTGNINAHMHEKSLLLGRYCSLDGSDLSRVFPEIASDLAKDGEPYNKIFNLARFSYDLGTNAHRLFALRLLYDNLQNSEFRQYVKKNYNFSSKDLYAMTSNAGIFNLHYLRSLISTRVVRLVKTVKKQILGFALVLPFRWIQRKLVELGLFTLYLYLEKLKDIALNKPHNTHIVQLDVIKLTPDPSEIVFPQQYTSIYPPNYSNQSKSQKVLVIQPPIFVKTFNNADIFGGLSYIVTGRKTFLDIHPNLHFDKLSLINDMVMHQKRQHILTKYYAKSQQLTLDEGIMLSGTATYNYYHWLIEFIPKLSILDGNSVRGVPFILDEAVTQTPALYEALHIIAPDAKTFQLSKGCLLKVGRLIYPSLLSWTTINIQKGFDIEPQDSITSERAIHYLREKFLDSPYNETGQERLYISRANTSNRKHNEAELIQIAEKYGFKVVVPELLSFKEQVGLFSKASHIIGATGGGMTNIVFAPKSAKILCLIAKPIAFAGFSNIAGILGQDMRFIAGKVDQENKVFSYQSSFYIDNAEFEKSLKALLS